MDEQGGCGAGRWDRTVGLGCAERGWVWVRMMFLLGVEGERALLQDIWVFWAVADTLAWSDHGVVFFIFLSLAAIRGWG